MLPDFECLDAKFPTHIPVPGWMLTQKLSQEYDAHSDLPLIQLILGEFNMDDKENNIIPTNIAGNDRILPEYMRNAPATSFAYTLLPMCTNSNSSIANLLTDTQLRE